MSHEQDLAKLQRHIQEAEERATAGRHNREWGRQR